MLDELFLSLGNELNYSIVKLLVVLSNWAFLVLVDFNHGSVKEASHESLHVWDGTIDQELLNEILDGEGFQKPDTKADVSL